MCRHLAYLGASIRLSRLLFEPPHSLSRQASQPKDMRKGGTINADGFGVGWYVGDTVLRHRRATPIWSDADLLRLAEHTASTAVLAAIRSATAGMPVTEGASAPFTDGRRLFSLNGRVEGWPHSITKLAAELPLAELLTPDAPTDAAFLWTLLRHRLRDGADPAETVRGLVADVAAAAPGSRLNLLYTDGVRIVATTWTHALSVLRSDTGVTVASEPFDDDPGWEPIGDAKLITATATGHAVTDLNF